MAIVRNITYRAIERLSTHKETECTFYVGEDDQGHKYLQLDTYGSASRQKRGEKSQSIRLSPDAIQQLKAIFSEYDL